VASQQDVAAAAVVAVSRSRSLPEAVVAACQAGGGARVSQTGKAATCGAGSGCSTLRPPLGDLVVQYLLA